MRCIEKTAAYKSRTIEIRVCAELTSHHATSFPPIHCSPSMYIYKTANIYTYILYTHTPYIHIPHIVCPLYAIQCILQQHFTTRNKIHIWILYEAIKNWVKNVYNIQAETVIHTYINRRPTQNICYITKNSKEKKTLMCFTLYKNKLDKYIYNIK